MDESQSMILYSDAHPTSEDTAWEHTALVPSGGESIEQALTRLVDEQASLPDSALTTEHLPQDYYQPSRAVATRQYGGVPTLTADGKVNPAWLDSLTLSLGLADSNDVLKSYGTPAQIAHGLDKVHGLLADPGRGTLEFMQAVYDTDTGAYTALVDESVRQHPDRAASLLQQSGYITGQSHQYEQEYLDEIPWHLQDVARSLDEETFYDLMCSPEHVRNAHLERELELREVKQAREADWDHLVQLADSDGQRSIQWLSNQYEQGHMRELRKWRPCGSDETANERARFACLQGSYFELRGDPRFDNMVYQAFELLARAPRKRLVGDEWGAQYDEETALELARIFNTRLGELIKAYISTYSKGGTSRGNTVSRTGEPPRLDKYGNVNPRWLEWLAA